MAEKKRFITTRALPARMMPPAGEPKTKPLMTSRLKLRSPDIPRERIPGAIDRSGERKTILTIHEHLAPREPGPKPAPEGAVVIAQGKVATVDGVYVGQAVKPAAKERAKR